MYDARGVGGLGCGEVHVTSGGSTVGLGDAALKAHGGALASRGFRVSWESKLDDVDGSQAELRSQGLIVRFSDHRRELLVDIGAAGDLGRCWDATLVADMVGAAAPTPRYSDRDVVLGAWSALIAEKLAELVEMFSAAQRQTTAREIERRRLERATAFTKARLGADYE
jgi:hypothetical protein